MLLKFIERPPFNDLIGREECYVIPYLMRLQSISAQRKAGLGLHQVSDKLVFLDRENSARFARLQESSRYLDRMEELLSLNTFPNFTVTIFTLCSRHLETSI